MWGGLFFVYRQRSRCSHWLAAVGVAGMLVSSRVMSGAAVALAGMLVSLKVPYGMSVTLPVLGTYLVFYAAYTPAVRLHRFARYGDFSYGIYLYAFAIQQLLVMRYGERLTPITLFLAATGLSVIAGVLSWQLIEKHFLQLKRSKADGEREGRAGGSRVGGKMEAPVLAVEAVGVPVGSVCGGGGGGVVV